MDNKQMIDNVANRTGKLLFRIFTKPFCVELGDVKKWEECKSIDRIGFGITIFRTVLSIIISLIVVIITNTEIFEQKYFENMINLFQVEKDLFITIFGGVLTAFSVMIALWSGKAIRYMTKHETKNSFSTFEEVLISYMSMLMWSVLIIVIDVMAIYIMQFLPNDFVVFKTMGKINDYIVSVILFIYSLVVFNIFLYIFDLLFNLYVSLIIATYFQPPE